MALAVRYLVTCCISEDRQDSPQWKTKEKNSIGFLHILLVLVGVWDNHLHLKKLDEKFCRVC